MTIILASASPLLGSKSSNKYGESGSTLLRRSAIARFKGSLLGGSKSFCAGGFGSHRSLPFVATDSLIRATTTELPPEWAELLGRKALLYVSDTTNLAQLGAELVRLGFTLVSFGDTLSFLEESGLPVERINTNDMFVGVFMGTIGIVVLNFYSNQRNFTFKGDVRDIDHGLTQLIVNIVKDHNDTLVAVDSVEYPAVIDYLIEEDRKRHLRYYPIEDEASIKREGFHDELVWKACSHVFRYLRAISDQAATYCE